MKEYLKKHLNLKRIIVLLSVAVLTVLLSIIFIKFLGDFLALFKLEQAANILRQLKHQKTFIAFYIPLIFIFINFAIIDFLKNHNILRIFLLILSVFLSFILTVILSKINGILILRVLAKAIKILLGGAVSLWRNVSP